MTAFARDLRLAASVSPADPIRFVGVSLLLLAATLTAALSPALRVTRIDPVETLRAE